MTRRNNLRVFRIQHSLTQVDMAAKIGVGRSTYSLVEIGKRRGNDEFWYRLQKTFNVPDTEMYQLTKKQES